MKNGRQITENLTNEKSQNGIFLRVLLGIYLNFWIKYYTWMENFGNEDSDAIFPKSLGGTNKRTDFVTAVGKYCDL